MNILLEYRKIKGKKLLMKFKFDAYTDGIDRRMICYSVDKYMSLDAWTNLYEKITKPIDRYVKNETEMPPKETITMRRAQYDLNISWQKCDSMHLSMLGLESDEVYTYLMVIKVRTVSKVKEYLKIRSISCERNSSTENNNLSPKRNESEVAMSSEHPTVSSGNPKSNKIESTGKINEPFDTVHPDENSIENEGVAKAGSLELIARLRYQPREANPILNPTGFDEICLSDEIYHDDSYDAYELRQNAIIHSESMEPEFSQFSDDRKLSEKREIEHDGDDNEIKKKRNNPEVHDEISERIGNETQNDTDKTPNNLERLVDLKDLSVEELNGTFATFSPILKKMFKDKKSEICVERSTEYDFSTIITQMLTNKQYHAMVDTLTEELIPREARENGLITVVPEFHDLFWEYIVPEWALLIFMEKYDLTRAEALDQLQRQDKAIMETEYPFDSN